MKKLLCILLVGCLMCALFSACGTTDEKEEEEKSKTESAEQEATESEPTEPAEPVDVYEIKTKFATLKYPAKWQKKVNVEVDDGDEYTVRFSSNDTDLFNLIFNGQTGELLGTIPGDSNTIVTYVCYKLNKKDKNYQELSAMSDDMRVIVDNLVADYGFIEGEAISDDDGEVFEIKTKLTSLYYPKKWEDRVTVKVDDDAVHFTCDNTKLFDLHFGGSKGNLLGTYDGTEIRIEQYEIEQGKMSDYAYGELLGMRDAVNVIIDHLSEDEKFEINM